MKRRDFDPDTLVTCPNECVQVADALGEYEFEFVTGETGHRNYCPHCGGETVKA